MTDQSKTTAGADAAPSDPGSPPPRHDLKWFERPDMGSLLTSTLLAVGAVLLVAGLFFPGHSKLAIKKIPAFYAITAVVSVVFAAAAARLLRGLFHVGEDYYDR